MEKWSQNFALARISGLSPDSGTGKWIAIGPNFHGYDDEGHIVIIPDFTSSFDELRFVLRKIEWSKLLRMIVILAGICDREYGNDEIALSDVYSPVEMSAMFLTCPTPFVCEAILKTYDAWVEST